MGVCPRLGNEASGSHDSYRRTSIVFLRAYAAPPSPTHDEQLAVDTTRRCVSPFYYITGTEKGNRREKERKRIRSCEHGSNTSEWARRWSDFSLKKCALCGPVAYLLASTITEHERGGSHSEDDAQSESVHAGGVGWSGRSINAILTTLDRECHECFVSRFRISVNRVPTKTRAATQGTTGGNDTD